MSRYNIKISFIQSLLLSYRLIMIADHSYNVNGVLKEKKNWNRIVTLSHPCFILWGPRSLLFAVHCLTVVALIMAETL